MSGQMHNDGAAPLSYHLAGGDVTARVEDHLRFYFEYAIRQEDAGFFVGRENIAYGTVYEAELRLCDTPRVGLLARYDTLVHHDVLGDSSLERFTWGLNFSLPGGSLLLINHEHWIFADSGDVDVRGLRWRSVF